MAFRYLIYRTDFGNTIVRENPTDNSTGGTETALFSDFVIPEIQPLYLWRVTGGTDVVPNTDGNINAWLNATNPPSPDDPVTYNIFTGYTAQTQTDLDGKINIVTGATGNVPIFLADGNVEDSGFTIADLTGSTGGTADGVVSGATLNGSAQLILSRTQGLPNVIADLSALSGGSSSDIFVSGATLSGQTLVLSRSEGQPDVTVDLSPLVGDLETDIIAISASTVQNAADILTISGDVVQNSTDIQIVSGATTDNADDIAFISGVTDTKQDALSAGEGISVAGLVGDTIQVDLSAFTAIGGFNITLTGGTDAVINDLRTIATGLEYNADYSANFTVRSLVDKGYVDAIAAGLDLKQSVLVATTSGETDIDLTGGTFGGVIDGYTLQDGNRVLIKNQDSTKEENGIYSWNNAGSTFTRTDDFVDPNVTSGAFTFIETGTTNGGSGWVLVTQDPIVIGTTELTFTQFSSTGSITAGHGIDITNGVVSVDGEALNGDFIEWTGTVFNVTGLTTIADFNSYTGATDTRISNIENDVTSISGDVVQNTTDILTISGDVVQNTTDIGILSGITDTKLDTTIFTGYTASTQSNELFLIHTGGTELNNTIATGIVWNTSLTLDSVYSFTGNTIEILETGEYELSYNIPFNQVGGNSAKGIGGNIILNGTDVLDLTAAAGWSARDVAAGSVGLPTVNISFTANDKIVLAMFRTAQSGSALSSPNGTILIKKKSTLQ